MNALKMNKVVVTGSTSMIGLALMESLLRDSEIDTVYAVVRPDSTKRILLPEDSRIKIIECDTKNYRDLANMIDEPCDVFYHLAWPRTPTYDESLEDVLLKTQNIQTVLYAADAAIKLGCRSFIGAGSQSEYGVYGDDPLSPDSVCKPVRADGIIHLAAGQLVMNMLKSSDSRIDCNWMRIFSVYGIHDRTNSMIMNTLAKLLRGEHCAFTPAEQKWDYLYADDIGCAFYLVGKKVTGSHVYCVGSGKAKPLKEYIETIRDIVAPGAKLGIAELPYPDDPVMYLCADISSLRRDTGWIPVVSFEEGISRIYNIFLRESESGESNITGRRSEK